MPSCNTAGQSICSNACVDKNIDKNNCGSCGMACEGYQYCSAGKCVPHYEWTRVLPLAPLDAIGRIHSAAVASNGDIVVEVDLSAGAQTSTLTLSNAQETNTQIVTTYQTVAIGRYGATGTLRSGNDLAFSFIGMSAGIPYTSVSSIALTPDDDIMVAGFDAITHATNQPGTAKVLTRLDSKNSLNRKWAATYPDTSYIDRIFPRPIRGDYVTIGLSPDEFHGINGNIAQVGENSSTASVLMDYLDNATEIGVDKSTLWFVGGSAGATALSGANKLNPWSPMTWNITSGQSFIIGAKDDGTSIGPWFTSNAGTRSAGLWKILVNGSGDLIVLAAAGGGASSGAVSLNGSEILSDTDILTLFKVKAAGGAVAWKTAVTSNIQPLVTIAPDGNAVAVSPLTSTYGLTMFADANGSVAASFTGSGQAQVITSGSSGLYVLGVVSGSADFNPGAGTDIQGNLPGMFISRFSY
jgi:hypothetical protein